MKFTLLCAFADPASLEVLYVAAGNTYAGYWIDWVICSKHMDWECKKMVRLYLTHMAATTSFNNNFVAGLAAEKYFTVKLQLVGCKKDITNA